MRLAKKQQRIRKKKTSQSGVRSLFIGLKKTSDTISNSIVSKIPFTQSQKPLRSVQSQSRTPQKRVSFYKRKKKASDAKTISKIIAPKKEVILSSRLSSPRSVEPNPRTGVFVSFLRSWKESLSAIFTLAKSVQKFEFSNFRELLKTYYRSLWKTSSLLYLSRILSSFLLLSTVVFIVYISFFDTFFVIQSWNVTFEKSSYLDNKDVSSLIDEINTRRQLSLFPLNSYFFINDLSLTTLAQEMYPSIRSVSVSSRQFPRSVQLTITTQPILATLALSVDGKDIEYWRVNTQGEFVAKDELQLKDNVIFVDRIISFDRDGATAKDIDTFVKDKKQLDRLYFVYTIQDWLETSGYSISQISIPSINSADYEVHITLTSGSQLLFDYSLLNKTSLLRRINEINRSNLKNELLEGKIRYIDLRLSRNIYVCYAFLNCDPI